MQVSKIDAGSMLPYKIYSLYLETINGINFTRREIDIIACIQSGRSTKRIASFLLISPRTVENHTRNIMLKLGYRTQEGIIDFIEKSGKFTIIKQYYSNLLLQSIFEMELKKIAILSKSHHATCFLVYEKEDKNIIPFINQLKNHLELSGIKTLTESLETNGSENNLLKKINAQNMHFVIYSLPETDIDKITLREQIQYPGSSAQTVLNKLPDFKWIEFSQQGNYYFTVLETVIKLLPGIAIDKNIAEFKKEYEALHEPFSIPAWASKIKSPKLKESNSTLISISKSPKKSLLVASLLFLTPSVIGFLVYDNKHPKNSNSQEHQLTKATALTIDNTKKLESFEKSNPNADLVWGLPPQHHKFVGREKLLEMIDINFHPGDHQVLTGQDELKKSNTGQLSFAVNVFVGLGGVGKTQLAMEYIHNSKYPYKLRAWFSAESIEQLKKQYIEFAKFLGYKEQKIQFNMALAFIKQALLNHSDWLLVYDGANNYDEIKNYFPEGQGNIILTTRQRNWPSSFKTINVNVMSEAESIELIKSLVKNEIGNNEKIEKIIELVDTLGYLPLALAHAGSYIQQNSISIQDYLDLYKKHEADLLLDNATPEGTDSLPVEITWNITLDAIVKDSYIKNNPLLALHLLTVCSYLSPEKIPSDLLLSWIKEAHPEVASPNLILPKLIGQLYGYSMIEKNHNGDIAIHPLVQTVLRHQHKQTVKRKDLRYPELTLKWFDSILISANTEFHRQTKPSEDETRKSALYPHLQSLLRNYEHLWPMPNTKSHIGDIIFDIGEITVKQLFNTKMAKLYYERGLPLQKQFYGENHPKVAYALRDLGSVYRKLGDYQQAKILFEQALKIQEQHYEKNHPEVASFLTSVGFVYRLFGQFEEANLLLKRALNIQEQHYGKNHPEVAIILECLGIVDYKMENYQEAKNKFERALNILESHYDENHPTIAYVLRNLGYTYAISGDPKKAITLLENALKSQKIYCSINGPEIAFTLGPLGYAYGLDGDYKQGVNLLEQSLRTQEEIYGNNHPEVAFTLKFLGVIRDKQKDYKQAKVLLDRAANIQERFYGKEHIETKRTLNILAKLPVKDNAN